MDITTLAPDIELDIRYVGSNNFVGKPVRGYNAPKCFLLAPVADALAKVEADLRQQGHGLRIYDCYRPARAVRHFVEWSEDLQDQQTKARHYPNLDKRELMGEYISATSGHSRGATLDLTLLQCTQGECEPLDMGTDFDLFDASANTDSPLVTEAQHANRQRLKLLTAAHPRQCKIGVIGTRLAFVIRVGKLHADRISGNGIEIQPRGGTDINRMPVHPPAVLHVHHRAGHLG